MRDAAGLDEEGGPRSALGVPGRPRTRRGTGGVGARTAFPRLRRPAWPRPLRRCDPAPSTPPHPGLRGAAVLGSARLGARPTSQRPRAARACPVRAQRPRPWERPGGSWRPGAEGPIGAEWARGGRGAGWAGAAAAERPGKCRLAEPGHWRRGGWGPARPCEGPSAGVRGSGQGLREGNPSRKVLARLAAPRETAPEVRRVYV